MSERGKIMPRRLTGNSKNHQEMVEKAKYNISILFMLCKITPNKIRNIKNIIVM